MPYEIGNYLRGLKLKCPLHGQYYDEIKRKLYCGPLAVKIVRSSSIIRKDAISTNEARLSMTQDQYFALIPAAGVGARMGSGCPKQYITMAGRPMLRHTISAFLASTLIAKTFVVVSHGDVYADAMCAELEAGPETGLDARFALLRCGGVTRQESVRNGLLAMRAVVRDDDWVLVHDAARPGLQPDMIAALIDAVGDDLVGGLLALPVVDTVKRASGGTVQTLARDGLWLAQTPQMFRYGLLLRALTQAMAQADGGAFVTDEASAVEALGLCPKLVPGHPRNLKVTLASDVEIAAMYLGK
jgi:2-C-methyl-D-erythritol 4-phosphate cytidylyltransferase